MIKTPTGDVSTLADLKLENQTVFVRLDFNVPLGEKGPEGLRTIEDDTRIRESIPTLKYLIDKGAQLVLASHLGRPGGRRNEDESLEPVALHLAKLLARDVQLADDCVGDGIELLAKNLTPGQVLLLENLRFNKGEEACDAEFIRKLRRLSSIYITDAFGTSHRKHASTYGLAEVAEQRGVGFLIEKELKFLDPLVHAPVAPFYAVLGGSKVSDKIRTIDSLLKRVQGLLIGGAMAHAFWQAKGIPLPAGAKQPKPEDVEAAGQVMREAEKRGVMCLIPDDTNQGFDIGPKTIARYIQVLSGAKTVFWNGPLGWFEKPEYAEGTFAIARALAEQSGTVKVVGGGDTVSAVVQSGVSEQFDHLSTGGGAVLEYLEDGKLPGIEVLKRYAHRNPNV